MVQKIIVRIRVCGIYGIVKLSESRIVADDADDADFCLLSVFGEEGGGLCITVWGRKLESLRYKSVGNRSSLLQKIGRRSAEGYGEPAGRAYCFYSKVYNYLDTVGRGYKPRQRGWGGAATLQNVNLFLDFTIITGLDIFA